MSRNLTSRLDEYDEDGVSLSSSSVSRSDSVNWILHKASKIQKKYPKYYLCGSVALMLYFSVDILPNDIDFAVEEKDWRNIKPTYNWEKIKESEYTDAAAEMEISSINGGYIHSYLSDPYPHCIFVHEKINPGPVIKGLQLQSIDDILKYKKEYNRKKDNEIDWNHFLRMEDFLV